MPKEIIGDKRKRLLVFSAYSSKRGHKRFSKEETSKEENSKKENSKEMPIRKSITSLIIISGMLLLLLITACQTINKEVIVGKDALVQDSTDIKQAECEDAFCGENERCVEGRCYCTEGYRTCIDHCIPEEGCCFDAECESRTCSENKCEKAKEEEVKKEVKINSNDVSDNKESTNSNKDSSESYFSEDKRKECDTLSCPYDQICTEENICGCPIGERWCNSQSQCMPYEGCCDDLDCRSSYDCNTFTESLNVCLDYKGEEICKRIKKNNEKGREFFLDDGYVNIRIIKILDDGKSAYLSINGKQAAKMSIYSHYSLNSGHEIYYDRHLKQGGTCQ